MAKAVSTVLRDQFPHLYPKEETGPSNEHEAAQQASGHGEGGAQPGSGNGTRPGSSYGSGAYVQRQRAIDAQVCDRDLTIQCLYMLCALKVNSQ